jgi:hypothetical protein
MPRIRNSSDNSGKSDPEASSNLEHQETEAHPLDESDVPASLDHSSHVIPAPMLKKDNKNLTTALAQDDINGLRKKVEELSDQVLKLTNQIQKPQANEQIDNETRSRLVDKLINIFIMIVGSSIIMILIGSFGGSHVNKEMIQQFVPLLVNVASGLIGVVIGYYYTGNNNQKRR